MNTIEYKQYTDTQLAYDNHSSEIHSIAKNAFGRDDDFDTDIKHHALGGDITQIILDNGREVGFSTYSVLPEKGLYLEGIAIRPEYQGMKLAHYAIKRVMEGLQPEYIAATTRNPSSLKLVAKLAIKSAPNIYLQDPLEDIKNIHIQKAISACISHKSISDTSSIPYVKEYYPEDLYGSSEAPEMPIDFIKNNPRSCAIIGASLVE